MTESLVGGSRSPFTWFVVNRNYLNSARLELLVLNWWIRQVYCSILSDNVWGDLWILAQFCKSNKLFYLMQLQILSSIKDSLLFPFKHPCSPSCIATWNGMKSRQCKTFHVSQWIVNWTNWYMYTRCLNKEWQTWEFEISSNQQNQHICVLSKYQQMFGFTLTAIDRMQNHFCIASSCVRHRVEIQVIAYDRAHLVFDSYKEQMIKNITRDKRLLVCWWYSTFCVASLRDGLVGCISYNMYLLMHNRSL